jgi:hypothetical protein
VLLIDGQQVTTPLRAETVKKGQFKGLAVLDRWQLQPSFNDLITELGPDLGKPKYYRRHQHERGARESEHSLFARGAIGWR